MSQGVREHASSARATGRHSEMTGHESSQAGGRSAKGAATAGCERAPAAEHNVSLERHLPGLLEAAEDA